MNEILGIAIAIIIGICLGVIFFGGLWWTVEKGIGSKRPGLWFFLSFLLRVSIALVGFYFVGNHHWQRMIVSLIGFVLARTLVTLLTKKRSEQNHLVKEVNHEPQS